MANIASFAVQLDARIGTFEGKLKTAEKRIKQLERQGRNSSVALSGMVQKLTGVATAYLSVSRSLGSVVSAFKEIGKLTDISERTGFMVKELASIGKAGEDVGTSFESIEKGIVRMNRSIHEAENGNKVLASTFKALGLDAKALAAQSGYESFKAIADRMALIQSESAKTAYAMQIFGRGGVDLINILNLGSDGLKEFEQRAKEAGLYLSQQHAQQVDAAADAWGRLLGQIKGIGNRAATLTAPLAGGLANALSVIMGAEDKFTGGTTQRTVSRGGKGFSEYYEEQQERLLQLAKERNEQAKKEQDTLRRISDVEKSREVIGKKIADLINSGVKGLEEQNEKSKKIRDWHANLLTGAVQSGVTAWSTNRMNAMRSGIASLARSGLAAQVASALGFGPSTSAAIQKFLAEVLKEDIKALDQRATEDERAKAEQRDRELDHIDRILEYDTRFNERRMELARNTSEHIERYNRAMVDSILKSQRELDDLLRGRRHDLEDFQLEYQRFIYETNRRARDIQSDRGLTEKQKKQQLTDLQMETAFDLRRMQLDQAHAGENFAASWRNTTIDALIEQGRASQDYYNESMSIMGDQRQIAQEQRQLLWEISRNTKRPVAVAG